MKNLLSRLVFLYNPLFFSRLVLISGFLTLQSPVLWAQDPGCFQVRIGEANNAQVGDTVCLPVTVSAVEGLVSIQFTMEYDTASLQLVGVNKAPSVLTGLLSNNFNITVDGQIRFGWFDQLAMGINQPSEGQLFEVCFIVKPGSSPGLKMVEINPDSQPTIYEAVQFLLPDWKSNILPFNHRPGGVWVDSVNGGGLEVGSCISIDTCGSKKGSIELSVSGNTPPYSFSWSGPNGFVSADSLGIYGIGAGQYSVTVTDGIGNSEVMRMTVRATNANISVTTNITNATCGDPTGCVTVEQYPQAPADYYSFAWSNGSVGPSACGLAPGLVYLTVTNNESGCTKAFYYYVGNNETGGYMFISKSGIQTCGGTGSAKVIYTPQNGLTFQFLWSTGDTTAEITGLKSGDYDCTVSVGNSCERVLSTSIPDYSTNTWNLKLISTCDPVTGQGNFVLEHNPNANNLTYPL